MAHKVYGAMRKVKVKIPKLVFFFLRNLEKLKL